MPVVNGYITRDELKAQVGLDVGDTEFDDLIDKAINAASRGIDNHTKRFFYQVAEERRFESIGPRLVEFGTFSDLTDETPITLSTDEDGDGTFEVWDPTEYELQPVRQRAAPEVRPWRRVLAISSRTFPRVYTQESSSYRVKIDGTWGWPVAVPDAVIEATMIQAHRLFKRREAPEGLIGLNMFGTVRMGKLDPDVRKLVRPYKITVVG